MLPSPEPIESTRRQTTMKKRLAVLVVSAVDFLAGCGSAEATGPATPTVTGSPNQPPSAPRRRARPPLRGPGFGVDDYTYTLRTTCFCPGAGIPVVVTVRKGKAISAVYAHRGRGHAAGDDAGDWQQITIDDVIEAANNEDAYLVKVRWPEGQDYPPLGLGRPGRERG